MSDNGIENKSGENNQLSPFILFAGQTSHDSLKYFDFNPDILIKGLKYGTDSDYYYNDSVNLDLDADNLADLTFKYKMEFHQPRCDRDGIDGCLPWGDLRITVNTIGNTELACFKESFYDMLLIDRLSYGDTIDHRRIWADSKDGKFISAYGLESKWNVSDTNGYLGYRIINLKDTVYGWIQMNTYNTDRIELYDYVIQKDTTH